MNSLSGKYHNFLSATLLYWSWLTQWATSVWTTTQVLCL